MTIREKGSLGTEGWELIFKERSQTKEDEASQLNRLGETRQAASLLQSFRRRQSSVLCLQLRPVSDASEEAIGFRTSSN